MSRVNKTDDPNFSYKDIEIDVTEQVIYTINRDKELYKKFTKARSSTEDKYLQVDAVSELCYFYAEEHNNEFGELFQTELDMVNWEEVIRRV
jgi:hypothetical protein